RVEGGWGAPAWPVDVLHRPAGAAGERRDVVRARRVGEVGVREGQLVLDEAVDREPPHLRVEGRHAAGDRIDAPSVRDERHRRLDTRQRTRDSAPHGPAPGKRRQATRDGGEKEPTPVAPRLGIGIHLSLFARPAGPVPPGSVAAGAASTRLTLIAAILGSAMVFIDGTVVNVALPPIQRDLGGGLAAQQWIVDSYLLTLGSLILVGGS